MTIFASGLKSSILRLRLIKSSDGVSDCRLRNSILLPSVGRSFMKKYTKFMTQRSRITAIRIMLRFSRVLTRADHILVVILLSF